MGIETERQSAPQDQFPAFLIWWLAVRPDMRQALHEMSGPAVTDEEFERGYFLSVYATAPNQQSDERVEDHSVWTGHVFLSLKAPGQPESKYGFDPVGPLREFLAEHELSDDKLIGQNGSCTRVLHHRNKLQKVWDFVTVQRGIVYDESHSIAHFRQRIAITPEQYGRCLDEVHNWQDSSPPYQNIGHLLPGKAANCKSFIEAVARAGQVRTWFTPYVTSEPTPSTQRMVAAPETS